MKKVFIFTIVFCILFLIFQFLINYLKVEHNISYILDVDGNKYSVLEIYSKHEDIDYYFFEIGYNGTTFLFEKDNTFNKQQEVIKKINKFEEDDLLCMSLKYIDNTESPVLCSIDGMLYSSYSVKDKYDLSSFVKKSEVFASKSEELKAEDAYIYKDFLYPSEKLLIYNYKTVLKFSDGILDRLQFSLYDNYENKLGVLVGKYYVIPKYTSKPDFSLYLAFDLENGSIRELELKENISKQSYVMGVYEKKIYLFDKSNMVQYAIDPYEKKVEVVGNVDKDGVILKNGTLENINVYDLLEEKKFEYDIKGFDKVDYDNIFVSDKFAIYIKGNTFYKVYKNYSDKPIMLFDINNFMEVRVINDKIYYIIGDTLFRYDENGVYPIVKREEFKYNNLNIYDIYFWEE